MVNYWSAARIISGFYLAISIKDLCKWINLKYGGGNIKKWVNCNYKKGNIKNFYQIFNKLINNCLLLVYIYNFSKFFLVKFYFVFFFF